MSRSRNALIAAAFSYIQTTLGILVSLYVTRFLVRTLGKDLYGTWLASGALLAYAALSDLGIFGVFPWLIAEADGKKDTARMRSVIAHGLMLGTVGGIFYAVTSCVLWYFFPSLLHLSDADRHALFGPILTLGGITALSFPLRLHPALRVGLQDYKFIGYVSVVQALLSAVLTIVLARLGFGLYALAVGTAVPPLLSSICSYARTRFVDAHLLRDWPKLSWTEAKPLVSSGAGQWLASLGWQLAFASDGVVIAYLGARDLIPMFVITSRLGLTLMQFGWTIPDAALVGLAHLNAEGDQNRTSGVVGSLIRLHLLISGGIACTTLALNAAFVQSWIGRDLFGGFQLNAIFAIDIVALSVTHALVTPTAVLGRRVGIGILTAANGVLHILLALVFGHFWGLRGVAGATCVSALLTSIPIAIHMLSAMTSLTTSHLLRDQFLPWGARLLPWAVIGCFLGWGLLNTGVLGRHGPLVVGSLLTAALGLGYLFTMKRLLRGLPFPQRVNRLLVAMKLV